MKKRLSDIIYWFGRDVLGLPFLLLRHRPQDVGLILRKKK